MMGIPWLFSPLVGCLLIEGKWRSSFGFFWLSLSFVDVDLGCIMYMKELIWESEGKIKISGTIWVERDIARGRKITK